MTITITAAIVIGLATLALNCATTVAVCAFFLGGVKAEIGRLNEWADQVGPKIVDCQVKIGFIKGHLGL